MNELITCRLPGEILALLMLRGSDVPRLKWHENPIALARRSLDAIDDIRLFRPQTLRDLSMAAAVRALLYLWCGWSKECREHADAAPEREGLYLLALCHRQMRRLGRARRLLRTLGDHPIHAGLAEYAVHIPGMRREPAFDRFLRLIERENRWESFLFADLYEQAASRRLERQGVMLIRKLAGKEAELLFRYCYEAAVGEAIEGLSDDGRDAAPPEPVKPQPATHPAPQTRQRPPRTTSRAAPTRTGASGAVPPLTAGVIKIICPSCRMISPLPPSTRGGITCCKHCQTAFHVPVRQSIGELVQ
ncbi:MAG: hypothetical protein ACE5EC_02450 [Phycisphaerae bacterium]